MVKKRGYQPFSADGNYDLPYWLKKVNEKRSPSEANLITKACALAEERDQDFYQSLLTADVLRELEADTQSLTAALIYGSFHQFTLSEEELEKNLGKEILQLVQGLEKIQALHIERQFQQAENLRRLLLAMVEDVRVVLIKLAEFTAKMRVALKQDEETKQRYASEAQEIYVALANRLGVGQIKWELEDLAFRFLQPTAYKQIAQFLDERRENREYFIEQVVQDIEKALKEQGIQASVTGRVKHIYSIWKKMQRKGVDYHQIYDVHAIRIIVSSVSECYAALGVIHTLWHHIPKEFDDYIANPKNNGYRSLHTAVFGPQGKNLEVQIRSQEMHTQAELGVAAHWQYKEGGPWDKQYASKLANLRQMLECQEDWTTDNASIEVLRTEVLQDRIYVLTPRGEVIELPAGATALDFAYYIHTELGDRCRGAKVGGQIVSLTTPLKSGDQVEILTVKTGTPSRDWLNPQLGYLKTLRARTKVQQWFKRQEQDKEKSLDLPEAPIKPELPQAPDQIPLRVAHKKSSSEEIIVSGLDNIYYQIARCCKPLPREEITGYLATGRGISVHRKDCRNILAAKKRQLSRLIPVEWREETQDRYLVDMAISAFDRPGLLRDISAALAHENINVTSIRAAHSKERNIISIKLLVETTNVEQLTGLFKRLQLLPSIISVERL